MLLASRDIIGGNEWVRENCDDPDLVRKTEKAKKRFAGVELAGKRLGVIGLGAIGAVVANTATRFGMEALGYDPHLSINAAWGLDRRIRHVTDINEIFRECDYITIHVPATDETKGMIGADAIRQMKRGVVVLNLARDVLVDEQVMEILGRREDDLSTAILQTCLHGGTGNAVALAEKQELLASQVWSVCWRKPPGSCANCRRNSPISSSSRT